MKPRHLLAEVLTRPAATAADAWLADGLRAWLASDGPSLPALGLQTPAKTRQALRDELLREAAEFLPGVPGQKAEALAQAARTFEVRRFDKWLANGGPPDGASAVDLCLWQILRLGARLPESTRQYVNIIG